MSPQWIIGVLRFLHDFFTVVWIGGLAFMVLSMLPSFKKVLGKSPQTQSLTAAVTRRHRIWVYVCIVGLFVTGLLLGRSEPGFTGFMHFNNLYSVLTGVKHIITFIMIIIAVFRSIYFGRKNVKFNPLQNKLSMFLIVVNFVLGVLVLLLSGFIASM